MKPFSNGESVKECLDTGAKDVLKNLNFQILAYLSKKLCHRITHISKKIVTIEEILNLINLKDTTKGEDIFQAVENCLCENNLRLEILSGLSIDGATTMIGKEKGA
ncbi:uncharacterized protein LOC118188567, partial [Stegodyphus dumicola]|uniref:uncharacterized protein LOC118188567 n=1 Tax=Stegodyphus dumicola TaxID=202533 RepID=UPI0015A9F6BA